MPSPHGLQESRWRPDILSREEERYVLPVVGREAPIMDRRVYRRECWCLNLVRHPLFEVIGFASVSIDSRVEVSPEGHSSD